MVAAPACSDTSCTALGIVREMPFEAAVPQAVDVTSATLELCIGSVCDTSRLLASSGGAAGERICEDLDSRTPSFPTTCTWSGSQRILKLRTNTVYGGHAGSDPLVLTAIAAGGARTELLRGTVVYQDTTDDAARGACTDAWAGTFTKQ